MPYIDIRIEFELDDDGDYVHATPTKAAFKGSDLDEDVIADVAESAFQSDRYTVGVSNAVLDALGGGSSTVSY